MQTFFTEEAFRPYLGRKFSWAIEQFRGLMRNAIAHLNPEDDVLDIDRFDDVMLCQNAVPVLQYMTRRMLNDELKTA